MIGSGWLDHDRNSRLYTFFHLQSPFSWESSNWMIDIYKFRYEAWRKFENWRLQLQLGCKLHRYLLQKAWHNIWGRWGFVPINFFLSKYCFLGKHPSYEIIFCQSVQYIEFYCFYDIFCFEITGLNNIIIFPPGLHKCLLTKVFSKSFCHYASTTDFSFKIYYIETVFLALW